MKFLPSPILVITVLMFIQSSYAVSNSETNLADSEEQISDSTYVESAEQLDLFRYGPYLILHCRLNGKSASFLIDTGASFSIINHKYAKTYGLTLSERKNLQVGGFGKTSQSLHVAIGAELDFGLKQVPTSFIAVDLSKLSRMVRAESGYWITGIIGTDLLKRYQCTIDFVNKALVLR